MYNTMVYDYYDVTQKVLEQLNYFDGEVTSTMLNDLISSNITYKDDLQCQWERYGGDVDIKKRTFENVSKANNKLVNNFRGLITSQLTSFVFGNTITYKLSSEKYDDSYNQYLQRFLRKNNYIDMDYQTAEMMSVCGVAYRLLYIDTKGQERMMNLNPWEVIYIKDETLDEVQYAMVYYQREIIADNSNTSKTQTYVEWYDNEKVTFYVQNGSQFVLDPNVEVNPQPHLFKSVPVIKFQNNSLEQGDWTSVEDLINAYDETISDEQNELAEFRLAYMKFTDIPTPEVMKAARQTGAFHCPVGSDISFITKDINDQFLENHKKTLETNILKFSSVVDYTAENFSGGTATGTARKMKLIAQESVAKRKEVKFSRALDDQFTILSSFWTIKNIDIAPEDIRYEFTRSLPIDIMEDADMASKLNGLISQETLLSKLSFIDDPKEEMIKMKREREANASMISLDDISGDTNTVDNVMMDNVNAQ